MDQSKKIPSTSSLLSVIGRLKLEHQQSIFKLNKQNEKLQAELSTLKEKSTKDDDTISCLRNENQTLLLRVKQFECEACEASHTENESNDKNHKECENVYEVDRILDDKLINRKKHYLVRWKGFNEQHDSWEPKRNLHCNKVLKSYEQSKWKK